MKSERGREREGEGEGERLCKLSERILFSPLGASITFPISVGRGHLHRRHLDLKENMKRKTKLRKKIERGRKRK